MSNKRIMVFGVFDGLHPGHRAFLRQAARCGKDLIVVVARDSVVRKLKKKSAKQKEKQRLGALRKSYETWSHKVKMILGDRKQSSYGVIKKYKPDLICLGYDQKWLEKDLKIRVRQGSIPKIRLVKLKPYYAQKFKSSKLNDQLFSNS